MVAINPGAINAYNAASKVGALGLGGSEPKTEGASFGDILKTATQGTINAQKVGEKASADAVLGKADLTDVVSAVNNAEMSLNLFIAIRDKMIAAYDQISRMQV